MSWLWAGYCGLVLISVSASVYSGAPNHLQINQWPRFCGLKFNRHANMLCLPSNNHLSKSSEHHVVQWYKVNKYDDALDGAKEIKQDGRIKMVNINVTRDARLHIFNLTLEDTGVYFCKINNTWGPGTELQVARPFNREKALYKTKMKDGLIIIQALLLAVCIPAILLRKRRLLEEKDSLYEEPEIDHIYEGLAIETCGGGLYEELTPYTDPERAEAPWE